MTPLSRLRTRGRAGRFVPRLEALEERTLLTIRFAAPVPAGTGGGHPSAVAVADFNRDGKLDVAAASPSGVAGVRVLLGTGTGGLTPAPGPPLLAGEPSDAVAAGDLTGDGAADLVVAHFGDDIVDVLLNDGHGGFTAAPGPPISGGLGSHPSSVALGDFNGDHKLDLVVALAGIQETELLTGNGNGTFTPKVVVGTNGRGAPEAVVVGDFDGDGKLDYADSDPNANTVQVEFGDGNGGLGHEEFLSVGAHPLGLAAGDFNGDGRSDLAVANGLGGTVSVLLGNAQRGFSAPTAVPVGAGPKGVAAADFDGDGRLDLAVTTAGGLVALQGDGRGGFAPVPGSPFAAGGPPAGVAVGDFNGDGAPDVVVANTTAGNVAVLPNAGAPPAGRPAALVGDVTALVSVLRRRARRNPATGLFRQRITLVNTGGRVLPGPIRLVLDGLRRRVRLRKARGASTGVTAARAPAGTAYALVNVAELDPGQRVVLSLVFANPSGKPIRYAARVVAGTVPI
jgi:FG-GAP-like repeat/FG-GAP repeat